MIFSKFFKKFKHFKQRKEKKHLNTKDEELQNVINEIDSNQSVLMQYQLSKKSELKLINLFERLMSDKEVTNFENDEICKNIVHSFIITVRYLNNLASAIEVDSKNPSRVSSESYEIVEALSLITHIALFFMAANESDEIMKRAVKGFFYIIYDEDHPLRMESFCNNDLWTTSMSILVGYQGYGFYDEYILPVFRATEEAKIRDSENLSNFWLQAKNESL